MNDIAVGQAAADFTLQTEKGETWKLSAQRGNVVALLFYPGDETLVCTKQLCSVRDNWNEYLATKAVVVGVSRGTVEQHQEFARHHHLPLPARRHEGRSYRSYRRLCWMPVTFTEHCGHRRRASFVIMVMSRARRRPIAAWLESTRPDRCANGEVPAAAWSLRARMKSR
jgi:peroxiredoxin